MRVEEVLRSFTQVKVAILQSRNTLLQEKVCIQNVTQVKVQMYYEQNVLKVKVFIMLNGSFQKLLLVLL